MNDTYKRIRDLRIEKNMTQEELAKAAGYTGRSAINKIEKGEVDIPRSKIIAIAKALDVSPLYIAGFDERVSDPQNGIENESNTKLEKVIAMSEQLTDKELDFVLITIQALFEARKEFGIGG